MIFYFGVKEDLFSKIPFFPVNLTFFLRRGLSVNTV